MRWVRRHSLQAVTCRGGWKRRAQNKQALQRVRRDSMPRSACTDDALPAQHGRSRTRPALIQSVGGSAWNMGGLGALLPLCMSSGTVVSAPLLH